MYYPLSLDVSAVFWWTKLLLIANIVIQLIYPGFVRVHDVKRECICRCRNSRHFRVRFYEQNLIFNYRIRSDLRQYLFHVKLLFQPTAIANTLFGSQVLTWHNAVSSFTGGFSFDWPRALLLARTLKRTEQHARSEIYFYFNSSFCTCLQEPSVVPSVSTSLLYTVPLVW